MIAPRPVRLRRKRAKGWNLQAASRAANGLPGRAVMRPGPHGNPFAPGVYARVGDVGDDFRFKIVDGAIGKHVDSLVRVADEAHAAALYRFMIERHGPPARAAELIGLNLFCACRLCDRHARTGKPFNEFCPDCAPCHADTLGAAVAAMMRCEEVG